MKCGISVSMWLIPFASKNTIRERQDLLRPNVDCSGFLEFILVLDFRFTTLLAYKFQATLEWSG